MTQFHSIDDSQTQIMRTNNDEIFTYNGSTVKIITVFNDTKESTALVEDENGEIFQVPKNSLRH